MNRPVVSVVMPAYNAERTIAAAVTSVLGQTFADLELVVCNDASADRTAELLAAIDDPRLKVIHNAKNSGEGPTRDAAIAAATAPWLAVIDADDVWAPERLERLLAQAVDGNCMVFDDLLVCHDADGELVPWQPLRGRRAFGARGEGAADVSLEDYLRAERLLIKPLFPAAVVRDNGIRHSDRKFGADTEFFIRVLGQGVRARYLPEPMYWYRIAPGSMTAQLKNPTLMRRCLEDCRAMRPWPDSVQAAFADKIAALHRNETLYGIADSLRKRELGGVFRHIGANPGVLSILPRRVLKHLYYQVHRVLHGGIGRRG